MSHATAVANNDEASRMITGENGHAALSAAGLGDTLLALFDKLVRGLPEDSVRANVAEVMKDARERAEPEMVKNLFVMTFHTRWCRGGKGERTLFYTLLKVLYALYPTVVLDLADLIPKYGYWKDLLSLLIECPIKCSAGQDVDYSAMHAKVWSLFARQIQTDLAELQCAQAQHRTPQLSLCAKFAPSEGGKHSKALQADKVYTPPSPPLPLSLSSIHTHNTHKGNLLSHIYTHTHTKEICKLLFPAAVGALAADDISWHHTRAKYRRMLTKLRKELQVPETLMCAQRWAEVEFAKVPSLCMDRQKRALLNENKKGEIAHPDDPERQACREKLLAHIVDKGVAALKGRQLFPHELVQQVCNTYVLVFHTDTHRRARALSLSLAVTLSRRLSLPFTLIPISFHFR
jgi:hypothetical protein